MTHNSPYLQITIISCTILNKNLTKTNKTHTNTHFCTKLTFCTVKNPPSSPYMQKWPKNVQKTGVFGYFRGVLGCFWPIFQNIWSFLANILSFLQNIWSKVSSAVKTFGQKYPWLSYSFLILLISRWLGWYLMMMMVH